jgi:hypothetical protein
MYWVGAFLHYQVLLFISIIYYLFPRLTFIPIKLNFFAYLLHFLNSSPICFLQLHLPYHIYFLISYLFPFFS